MLRCKQRSQLHARRIEKQIDAAAAARIPARVVRDETDPFAPNEMDRIPHEHSDARRDRRRLRFERSSDPADEKNKNLQFSSQLSDPDNS